MSEQQCADDSLIPLWFTGVYFGLNIAGVIVLLCKAYNTQSANTKYKTFGAKLWDAIKSVRKKRSCYFPFMTHIFDQSTDIGVIVEFYLLWQFEERYKSNHDGGDPCPGINGFYIFLCSCVSLFAYRIISSILVGLRTKSFFRGFLQFWDLLLFHALYINYKTHSTQPSNPQKWLQMLEAVFESFPQSLIQLFFIIKTRSSGGINSIVVVSLIFSILSLTNKVISDDSPAFEEEKGKTMTYKREVVVDYHGYEAGGEIRRKNETFVSFYYFVRIFYRVLDVLYRLSILVLIWVIMGGLALFIVGIAEFVVLIAASAFLHELSALCFFVLTGHRFLLCFVQG